MAKFKYRALKDKTHIVTGEVEASSPREARRKIYELGFLPTKVYTEEIIVDALPVTSQETLLTNGKIVKSLSLQEKIMFTSELEVMIASGIPILDALHSLENSSSREKIKIICHNVQKSIINGMTFATALASLYPKVFGELYITLVKTGEEAGELDITLGRMLYLLRNQDDIKSKIIRASIYPAVLILIMFGVLMLFSIKVFPAFYGVLQFNSTDIPFYSRMLIGFCQFINHFWWLVIVCIGAFCGAISMLFQNPQIKSKWDDFVLKIPVVSDFIQYINLSNFMSVLYIAYEAGVPIVNALKLSNKTIGNYTIKNKVANAINMVKNSKPLSEAFNVTGAIPSALITMIATGEKSGTLGKMFRDSADVIDKKVNMALEAMTRLFEPTLIVIMGIAVAFIAVGFYQMYFAMLGSLF